MFGICDLRNTEINQKLIHLISLHVPTTHWISVALHHEPILQKQKFPRHSRRDHYSSIVFLAKFRQALDSRPVRGSLNRFHVFCIWDRKCIRGAHGTWGNVLLYWWRARVCRVAMKCSRTGCRRRVHRGPGRAVSFVGPVFTGHVGYGFFKDLPCYGSETGVRT